MLVVFSDRDGHQRQRCCFDGGLLVSQCLYWEPSTSSHPQLRGQSAPGACSHCIQRQVRLRSSFFSGVGALVTCSADHSCCGGQSRPNRATNTKTLSRRWVKTEFLANPCAVATVLPYPALKRKANSMPRRPSSAGPSGPLCARCPVRHAAGFRLALS